MSPTVTWTEEEEAFLIKNYSERGTHYCVDNLERWGYLAVRSKIQKLKLRLLPGTKARINVEVGKKREGAKAVIVDSLIRNHGHEKSAEDIAIMAGVKRYYIHFRAKKIGLTVLHSESKRRISTGSIRKQMEKNLSDIEKLALYRRWTAA